MPRLITMMTHHHCKNHWKFDCDCEYCTRKSFITRELNIDSWNTDDRTWPEWAIFKSKKTYRSRELRELKQEAMF